MPSLSADWWQAYFCWLVCVSASESEYMREEWINRLVSRTGRMEARRAGICEVCCAGIIPGDRLTRVALAVASGSKKQTWVHEMCASDVGRYPLAPNAFRAHAVINPGLPQMVQTHGPFSVPDHRGRRLCPIITVDAGVPGWCASIGASSARASSARPASSSTRRRVREPTEGNVEASRHLLEGRHKSGGRGRWVAKTDCKRRRGLQENASVHCCYQDVLPVLHRARTGACSAC